MAGTRGWPSAVLLVTGVIALILGGLAFYARHTLLDSRAFAARATTTLGQDEVRDEIVSRITTRTIAQTPELAARRPLLEAAVADVVEGPQFPAEFNAGAVALHRALFRDGSEPTPLALPGAGGELRTALELRSPASARMLPPADPELLRLDGGGLESDLRRGAGAPGPRAGASAP